MSGASALASARRRRASANPDTSMSNKSNNKVAEPQVPQSEEGQKFSPLQILQLHDTKIKNLENDLDSKIVLLINNQLEQEFKKRLPKSPDNTSNNVENENNLKKLTEHVTKLENKIEELEKEKLKLNEETIISQLNEKLETYITQKITGLNNTISSILSNVEKLSKINTVCDNNTHKLEEYVSELNGLKLLVIKTQALSLETNSDMLKMKDSLTDLNETVVDLKNNNLDEENIFDADNNNTQFLLKSMFEKGLMQHNLESHLNKLNILDDEIVMDESNINELSPDTTDNNIESIKSDVLEEIGNFKETVENADQNLNDDVENIVSGSRVAMCARAMYDNGSEDLLVKEKNSESTMVASIE